MHTDNIVVVGEPLDPELFTNMLRILKKKKIAKRGITATRWGLVGARFCTFGKTKGRYDGILRQTSFNDRLRPDLSSEINKLGDILTKLYGINYNAVHLNNNVTCPPHKDAKNVGESILVSFGEYTGGNIVLQLPDGDKIFNAYMQPIIFNGSNICHWNTDDLQGDKYSLVYFLNFVD